MYNKFNKIKAILLLSALFFYGQNNVWAQDKALAAEKEYPEVGCKRTNEQAYLGEQDESHLQDEPPVKKQCISEDTASAKTSQENPIALIQTEDDYFDSLPNEILEKIINLFDIKEKEDKNSLLSLSAVCKKLRDVVLNIYTKANMAEHHYPWHDHRNLSSSTLYIANSSLRTLLGLYINIKKKWAEDADRIRFARLYAQFGKGPFTFASKYIEFLHLNLNCDAPILLQRPLLTLRNQLLIKMQCLEEELSKIVDRQDPNLQNETALYFHYIQFVVNTEPPTLDSLKSQSIFPQNNSLMAVMEPELLKLKATAGLSESPNFADIWKEIIDREPAGTLWQLRKASYSSHSAGKFLESLKFTEKFLRIQIAFGGSPPAEDYGKAATAYYYAGNYAKAAEYFEKRLAVISQSGESPTEEDYKGAALVYFHAGNYAKAAEYYGKQLEAISQSGKSPRQAASQGNAVTHNNLGFCLEKQGKFEEAIINYEKAVKQGHELSCLNLAYLLEAQPEFCQGSDEELPHRIAQLREQGKASLEDWSRARGF